MRPVKIMAVVAGTLAAIALSAGVAMAGTPPMGDDSTECSCSESVSPIAHESHRPHVRPTCSRSRMSASASTSTSSASPADSVQPASSAQSASDVPEGSNGVAVAVTYPVAPSPQQAALPVTGASIIPIMLIGVGMVAVGVCGVWIARKRRI